MRAKKIFDWVERGFEDAPIAIACLVAVISQFIGTATLIFLLWGVKNAGLSGGHGLLTAGVAQLAIIAALLFAAARR